MNGLALCAGAGGLELGLHLAEPGYRTVGFVEREARAAASLVARMADSPLGEAPVWDDLGTFDGRRWRAVLSEYPDLAPAVESRLRGVADGVADRLDRSRLALTGNGVVPLVAAHAWLTLRARLEVTE